MQSRSRLSVIVFILVFYGGHLQFNYRQCPNLNLREISESESEALVTHGDVGLRFIFASCVRPHIAFWSLPIAIAEMYNISLYVCSRSLAIFWNKAKIIEKSRSEQPLWWLIKSRLAWVKCHLTNNYLLRLAWIKNSQQVCIPVGCVPPACWLYTVTSGGCLPWRGGVCLGEGVCRGGGLGVCLGDVCPGGMCPSMWWGRHPPVNRMTDRQVWKHYLVLNFVCGR